MPSTHRTKRVAPPRLGALRLAALLAAIGAGGCGEQASSEPTFAVRDSAGIRIAESAAPEIGERLVVDSQPTTVVAGDFGEPEYYLNDADYIVAEPDGGLVVGNSGSRELFFFDAAGAFEYARGGPGDGPGEFAAVFGLERCGDGRLAVEEVRRISILGPTGDFERTVQISGHLADARGSLVGMSAGCDAALLAVSGPRQIDPAADFASVPSVLYWANAQTAVRDTVAEFQLGVAQVWRFRGEFTYSRRPYGPFASVDSGPGVVLIGEAVHPEVRLWYDSAPSAIVRWGATPIPLTDEDWTYWRDGYREFLRDFPEEREFLPELDFFIRPESKPAYASALIGSDGRIWVQRYGRSKLFDPEPSTEWLVFSDEGQWVADVTMPEGLRVLAATHASIVGIQVDELDVQHIHVHTLPPALNHPLR